MRSFNEHKQVLTESAQKDSALWTKWKSFVNLSRKEYTDTLAIIDLTPDERALSKTILSMIESSLSFEMSLESWTSEMWKVCKDQVAYITRMRSMRKRMIGNPFEKDGKMTKWLTGMLARAHDPRKPLRKVS